MGYSDNPHMVRVDVFKPSGKWYTTIALNWDRYKTGNPQEADSNYESIHDSFHRCMREQFCNKYCGMLAVCLEPYHENGHPLMITIPDHTCL